MEVIDNSLSILDVEKRTALGYPLYGLLFYLKTAVV